MTKKTGKSRKKGKATDQRHLRAVPSAPKMPLQLVMNHRVVDSLAVEFIHWHGTEHPDPADAYESLELLKLFLTAQHAIVGSSSATAIGVDGVHEAAEAIAGSLAPDDMDDALEDIYFAVHSYIHFLNATGHWSGTDTAYEDLHSLLGTGIAPSAPPLPEIEVPELSVEEQDSAFAAMPLIQRASSLLEWLGTGKDITSTGALRLKDIEPAAAAVGVKALGRRGARRPFPLLDQEADLQEPLLEVGTMHDVPVLREIWSALVGAGLVRLGSTRAFPGQGATAWNSPKIEERLHSRRMLAVVLLVRTVEDPDEAWDGEATGALLLAVLAAGTTANPMPVAELEKMASLDLAGLGLGIDDDLDLDDAADTDPDDPDFDQLGPAEIGPAIHASFMAMTAKRKLAMLAELGLVDAGIDYRVPPAAVQCLDMVVAYLAVADDPATDSDAPIEAGDSPSNVIALHRRI